MACALGHGGNLVCVGKLTHVAVVVNVIEAAAFSADLQYAGLSALDRVVEFSSFRTRTTQTGGRRCAQRRRYRRLGGNVEKSNRIGGTIKVILCTCALKFRHAGRIQTFQCVYFSCPLKNRQFRLTPLPDWLNIRFQPHDWVQKFD